MIIYKIRSKRVTENNAMVTSIYWKRKKNDNELLRITKNGFLDVLSEFYINFLDIEEIIIIYE